MTGFLRTFYWQRWRQQTYSSSKHTPLWPPLFLEHVLLFKFHQLLLSMTGKGHFLSFIASLARDRTTGAKGGGEGTKASIRAILTQRGIQQQNITSVNACLELRRRGTQDLSHLSLSMEVGYRCPSGVIWDHGRQKMPLGENSWNGSSCCLQEKLQGTAAGTLGHRIWRHKFKSPPSLKISVIWAFPHTHHAPTLRTAEETLHWIWHRYDSYCIYDKALKMPSTVSVQSKKCRDN